MKQDLPFKEKLANFWYYYKMHTIIGAVIALALIIGCAQCATRVEPDYKLLLAVDDTATDEIIEAISTHFEQFGEDLNGDGRVQVDVIDATTGYSADTVAAQSTKLMTELQMGETILIISDRHYYDKLTEFQMFEAVDWLPDMGGTAYNWRDTPLADDVNEASGGKIEQDIFIGKRKIKGTDFEKVERSVAADEAATKLLKRAISEWEK